MKAEKKPKKKEAGLEKCDEEEEEKNVNKEEESKAPPPKIFTKSSNLSIEDTTKLKSQKASISNLKASRAAEENTESEEFQPVRKSGKKRKSKSKSRSGRDTANKSKAADKEFGPYLEHPLMKGANPE